MNNADVDGLPLLDAEIIAELREVCLLYTSFGVLGGHGDLQAVELERQVIQK